VHHVGILYDQVKSSCKNGSYTIKQWPQFIFVYFFLNLKDKKISVVII